MTDEAQAQQPTATKRGEAAWEEAKERVAERNRQARKAGKQQRETYERQRDQARRAAARRQMAGVLGKRDAP